MAPRKRTEEIKGVGINFNTVTRAKLDLIAAGLDRPLGWIVRDAVGSYLSGIEHTEEFKEYRRRFPKLATALDNAIQAAGGDNDEVYGAINDVNSDSEGVKSNPK